MDLHWIVDMKPDDAQDLASSFQAEETHVDKRRITDVGYLELFVERRC